MKVTMLVFVVFAGAAFIEKDKLTGRWESNPSAKGNVTGVVFKSDNTFEGYINRKPFTSGKYSLEDDIFKFTDNGCEGKVGVYKLIFFSNEDSMRFEPIEDECTERKAGMSRLVMGKVNR